MSGLEMDVDLYALAELRPCPFCGWEQPLVLRVEADGDFADDFAVHCHECGATGASAETEAEAVASWNMRSAEARIAILEKQIADTMKAVAAECDHLRKRARKFLADPSRHNGYELAHSVVKHTGNISKEG